MATPRSFTKLLDLRIAGALRDGRRIDTLDLGPIAHHGDLRLPEIYGSYFTAKEIPLDDLPDVFVLKPAARFAGRVALMLHKITHEQGYWCPLTGQRFWRSKIRKQVEEWQAAAEKSVTKGPKRRILAQERVFAENGTGIPFDYEFYAFNGTIGLIAQIDRNSPKPKYAFFRGDFSPLDRDGVATSPATASDGEPEVPFCADRMLASASSVSRHLKSPFVRIDLFAGNDRPVLGEITHTAGATAFGTHFRLSPALDSELGELWTRAAHDLKIDVTGRTPAKSGPAKSGKSALPSA